MRRRDFLKTLGIGGTGLGMALVGVNLTSANPQHPYIPEDVGELVNTDIDLDLTPDQHMVLTSILDGHRTMVVACRGWGKTFMVGVAAEYLAKSKPGTRVGIFTASMRQSGQVFTQINKRISKRLYQSEGGEYRITFANGSSIRSFSPSDAHRLHETMFDHILLDEATHIPQIYVLDIMSTLLTPNIGSAHFFMSASHTENHMYRRFTKATETGLYRTYTFPWYSVPKGFLDQSTLLRAKAEWDSVLFDRDYGCEWTKLVRYHYPNPWVSDFDSNKSVSIWKVLEAYNA